MLVACEASVSLRPTNASLTLPTKICIVAACLANAWIDYITA